MGLKNWNDREETFNKVPMLRNRLETHDKVSASVAFEILKHIADYPFDLFKISLKSIIKELIEADFLKFV
jgi:hypothetical protein